MNENTKIIDRNALYHVSGELDDLITQMHRARITAYLAMEELESEISIESKKNYNPRFADLLEVIELAHSAYYDAEQALTKQNGDLAKAIGIN